MAALHPLVAGAEVRGLRHTPDFPCKQTEVQSYAGIWGKSGDASATQYFRAGKSSEAIVMLLTDQ